MKVRLTILVLLFIFIKNDVSAKNTRLNRLKQQTINIIEQQKNDLQNLIALFPLEIKTDLDFKAAKKLMPKIIVSLNKNHSPSNVELLTIEFLKNAKKPILWSATRNNTKVQAYCKWFYFTLNFRKNNITEVIETGTELLNFKEFMQTQDYTSLLSTLFRTYEKIQAYDEMIKLVPLREQDIPANKNAYYDGFSPAHELSFIYYKTKRYDLAITNFLIQKKRFQEAKNQLMISSTSNNIGLCYTKKYDYKNATIHFKQALYELELEPKINESVKKYNVFFRANIKSNIAQIEIKQGKYDNAIRVFNDLKKAAKIFPDEKSNITDAYLNLAVIYFLKNQTPQTIKYIDSCAKTFDNKTNIGTKIGLKKIRAKTLISIGEHKRAEGLFAEIERSTDSIQQIQLSRNNMLAQVKYNVNQREKLYQSIKTELKLRNAIAFRQKTALIITFFLLLIIVFLYYRKFNDSKTIDSQNEILKSNLTEKDMLLKEVHHRVKNNLQVITGLLQLQADKNNHPDIEQMIHNAESQINSIALMHQMLYQNDNFSIVSIKEYLQKLTDQLLYSTYGTNYIVNIDVEDINLSTDVVIPIGLIINELFTNSHKHAFENKTGIINISLRKMFENNYELNYTDNGRGLPEQFDTKQTMGFKLLKMLSEEISGSFEIKTTEGFHAIIKFKDNENE